MGGFSRLDRRFFARARELAGNFKTASWFHNSVPQKKLPTRLIVTAFASRGVRRVVDLLSKPVASGVSARAVREITRVVGQ